MRTILHIEDNPPSLRLVERVVSRRPGTRVVSAQLGTPAVDLARRHRPELVLLDMQLPDIDGDEVLRRLRSDPETSAIPVVMMSAETTPSRISDALNAGAAGYLTKPFDLNELLDLIDSPPPAGRAVIYDSPSSGAVDDLLDRRIVARLHSLYEPSSAPELADLMARFIDDVRDQVARLRAAAASADVPSVERIAHDLKGSTSLYGVRRLPELFDRLEALVTRGDRNGALTLLSTIEHEVEQAMGAVEREFLTSPGS